MENEWKFHLIFWKYEGSRMHNLIFQKKKQLINIKCTLNIGNSLECDL